MIKLGSKGIYFAPSGVFYKILIISQEEASRAWGRQMALAEGKVWGKNLLLPDDTRPVQYRISDVEWEKINKKQKNLPDWW